MCTNDIKEIYMFAGGALNNTVGKLILINELLYYYKHVMNLQGFNSANIDYKLILHSFKIIKSIFIT